MADVATLTTKHQMTVPAEVRDEMGLKPGDKVRFHKGPDGVYRFEKVPGIESLRGILRSKISLTDDQLRDAIEDAHKARVDEIMSRSAQ